MSTQSRRERLEVLLAQDPNDPELGYMLAMEHVSAGDDAGAVTRFQELLQVAPNYPHAYHQGARALARLNRLEEARKLLTRGIPVGLACGDQHAAGEMQELLASLE